PFTGSDISMETGVLFGVNANGGLIILDPFNSDVLENANMVVFAKSGAGKSFFLKTISSRLLPTSNVFVIDPEAEYHNLCGSVGGQYIRLSSNSLQLNPFELYTSANQYQQGYFDPEEDGNFFREKLLNLVTMFELLIGDEGTLTQKEKAFIYRCLTKTYANRGITGDPSTHVRPAPNMQEFFLIMTSVNRGDHRFGVGEDTFGLSERLERYLHIFPAKTRLELDRSFVDFNIRELNETLKPIGLFLITEFLWTKLRQARQMKVLQRNSIVLIDEAWLLMQFPQGAKFLAEFARRIRKYGGGLWCTTQNSDDFLGAEEGRTILAMSTMKFLMKQDSSTIDSVMRTFRLSPGQRNYLLAARRGEGLFATKSWAPMEVVASAKEAEMANTTLRAQSPVPSSYVSDSELMEETQQSGPPLYSGPPANPSGQTLYSGVPTNTSGQTLYSGTPTNTSGAPRNMNVQNNNQHSGGPRRN
ncbi:MAG: ATP-binding protein, partial [Ktedonobacteraceae bacterium]|nr:ATP-binding protein [Ktedonobacteraceae bacterium]